MPGRAIRLREMDLRSWDALKLNWGRTGDLLALEIVEDWLRDLHILAQL